jgi:uncharacterized protein YjbI with pentapeptide repeats
MGRLFALEGFVYSSNTLQSPVAVPAAAHQENDHKESRVVPEEPISAERIVKELTRDPEEPVYKLHDAKIAGPFNLRHRTIDIALDIQRCEFLGEVDLNYCEFKQAVNFSGCIFHKKFNSGDEVEAYTIYRKDLICNGTLFMEDATFSGARIEGDMHFSELTVQGARLRTTFKSKSDFSALKCDGYGFFVGARFESKKDINFEHASFGRTLDCSRAIFKGVMKAEALKCSDGARFLKARFESRQVPPDGYTVNFKHASFGGHLDCAEAVFKGPVSLNTMTCGGRAIFEDARFLSRTQPPPIRKKRKPARLSVDFTAASFDNQFDCDGAVFKGPVSFNAIKCGGSAYFKGTKFESRNNRTASNNSVTFTAAAFNRQFRCEGAVFKGAVSFNSIKCRDGFFQGAQFRSGEQNFRYASFEGDLFLDGATFEGKLTDFRYMRVVNNLRLSGVYVDTDVVLGHAHIGQKLRLEGSCFNRKVRLYDTEIGILELIDTNIDRQKPLIVRSTEARYRSETVAQPAEDLKHIFNGKRKFVSRRLKRERERKLDKLYPFKRHDLTLGGTTFTRFHGSPYPQLRDQLALRLAGGQNVAEFSRDPYLQLETYYRKEGNEAEARDIYREGRNAYRRNARDKDGNIQWNTLKDKTDLLWKLSTGYGVVIWRLLTISFLFLLLGTLIFYLPDNTDLPDHVDVSLADFPTVFATLPPQTVFGASVADTSFQITLPDHALERASKSTDSKPWQDELLYRAGYSVDLFLPLVNMHIDEKWEPNGSILQLYASIHAIVGWLVVPLLVAALAGIMKR